MEKPDVCSAQGSQLRISSSGGREVPIRSALPHAHPRFCWHSSVSYRLRSTCLIDTARPAKLCSVDLAREAESDKREVFYSRWIMTWERVLDRLVNKDICVNSFLSKQRNSSLFEPNTSLPLWSCDNGMPGYVY